MHVICLCARWCRLCNAYRATFEAVAARYREHEFAFIDIDIEDEADLLEKAEASDVVDFPTLLIVFAGELRFSGSVAPHSETLERIVRAAGKASLPPPQSTFGSGALRVLLQGLAARHLYLATSALKTSVP